MKLFLVSFSFVILLCACSQEESENNDITMPQIEAQELVSDDNYTLETYPNENETWGYRILKDDAQFINQPHIPAVQGNAGFSNQEKAEKAGNFVLDKLRKGIVPPTVSYSELDSLGVLN